MQRSQQIHWPSVGMFLISGVGMAVSLTSAAGFMLLGFYSAFRAGPADTEALSFFSIAWMSGLISLLMIPAVYYSLRRLFGMQMPAWRLPGGLRLASCFMVLWPFLLGLGHLVNTVPVGTEVTAFLLPPINILVVAIPLWWLVEIGRHGLQSSDPQRTWGVASFSLVVTPTITIFLELILLILLGIAAVLWLYLQPGALDQINRLIAQLSSSQMDQEAILRILSPYLQQPLFILAVLAVEAGLIPLLEELLKPLAVWILVWRSLKPADGFVVGLICGSAFGLFESLGNLASVSGSNWIVFVLARTGTGLLHTVSAGLVGWGLASAWHDRAYLKLALSYLTAACLHGLWNAFALLSGLASFLIPTSPS
ncbi:MAG: PrsW family glutamic-type intramembrane protease [Anaerolineaceae bacterium]|nr:PrsW family glutamic-type intramembrane protease [Anaerolineaceae bacterium]